MTDPTNVIVEDMSPNRAADWLSDHGARVVERRGILWAKRPTHFGGSLGYWQPVCELSAFPAHNVDWPTKQALGFRAVVDDPARATGSVWMQLLTEVQSYGPTRIHKSRRNMVRRGLRQTRISPVTDAEELVELGWPVADAAGRRTGYGVAEGPELFGLRVRRRFAAGAGLALAAYDGDDMVAFEFGHAIDGIGYLTHMCLDTDRAPSGTGSALYWAAICAFQRSGLDGVSFGASTPEVPGIHQLKGSFGILGADLPVISKMRLPVSAYLRRRRPITWQRSGAGRRATATTVSASTDRRPQ